MPLFSPEFKDSLPYKILLLLTIFPNLLLTIAIDRYIFVKKNPFLGIPRDTNELRRDKVKFFKLLQSGEVRIGCGGKEAPQLVPTDAIMVYVDVKDGSSLEPDKNRGVACVDVAYRMPPNAQQLNNNQPVHEDTFARFTTTTTLENGEEVNVTVLRLFVKMATARRWPLVFKALIATFSATMKEISMFRHFVPTLDFYGKIQGNLKLQPASDKSDAKRSTRSTSAGGVEPIPFPLQGGCPIPVPTCHYGTWNRVFDRTLCIFDCIDTKIWRPIADYRYVTEAHMIALVTSMAKFHAVTVGRVGDYAGKYNPQMLNVCPNDWIIFTAVSKCFPERKATAWIQAMLDAFIHKMEDPLAAKKFKAIQAKLSPTSPTYDAQMAQKLNLENLSDDLTPEQYEALNDGKYFKRFWDCLAKRLEKEVTTVSHCDCRVGNMLFCGGGGGLLPSKERPVCSVSNDSHPMYASTAKKDFVTSVAEEDDENAKSYRKDVATVVHLDWEACSLTPLFFDVGYSIAGRPERKRYEDTVLKAYLSALRAAVTDRLDRDSVTDEQLRKSVLDTCVPSYEEALKQVRFSYIIQGYFGWVLGEFGGIGQVQGNSKEDHAAWSARARNSIRAATNNAEAVALEIGHGASANDVRLFRYKMASVHNESIFDAM